MKVEIHDSFNKAVKIPANSVVVYGSFDNPIAVVVQVDGGQYVAATAAHKNFQQILKAMGIDKTLVVTHLDPSRLKVLDA